MIAEMTPNNRIIVPLYLRRLAFRATMGQHSCMFRAIVVVFGNGAGPTRCDMEEAVQNKPRGGSTYRRGGRQKGTPNKATALRRAAEAAAVASEGEYTPVEFLLRVMNADDIDVKMRIDAAKAAAPYIHAKLATEAESKDEGKPKPIADVGTPSVADAVERWQRRVEAMKLY